MVGCARLTRRATPALPALQLYELAVSIARGLAHLHAKNIVSGLLRAAGNLQTLVQRLVVALRARVHCVVAAVLGAAAV
jgi:hypothetical protein